MPTITVYLTKELHEQVKDNPSKIVQAALEIYLKEYCSECKKKTYVCRCV